MTAATENWHGDNRAGLLAELSALAARLSAYAETGAPPPAAAPPPLRSRKKAAPERSLTLDHLAHMFGLDAVERAVLLLCVGFEVDAEFAAAVRRAQGGDAAARPTIGLALAVLPDATWAALAPYGSLRRHDLLRVDKAAETVLSPLAVEECLLHYVLDGAFYDPELAGIAEPLAVPPSPLRSHVALAEQALALWNAAASFQSAPLVHLSAATDGDALAVAALIAEDGGSTAYRLWASSLPTQPAALHRLARQWTRLARLLDAIAVIELDARADAAGQDAALRFAELAEGPVVVVGKSPRPSPMRPMVKIEVPPPSPAEQRALWEAELSAVLEREPDAEFVAMLVSRFNLDVGGIREAAAAAVMAGEGEQWSGTVWAACRGRARPHLESLAERLPTQAGWDRLVVPPPMMGTLREIHDQVRLRGMVREQWGLGEAGWRGQGVTALFAGPSGTGKTLAAEVLAHELGLDLYRIDLASVVSKYIGETEKNLGRLFDAAEGGGAVLLFDEADALFGKRSDVKDSHDRYANIEVGYLLQRLESYGGLAILTSNLKESMDQAFQRRLRFVLDFPFPDEEQRARIWKVSVPAKMPVTRLDYTALGRLHLTGGQIFSALTKAACLAAADPAQRLEPAHLLNAVRAEYRKMNRPISADELAIFERRKAG